MLGDFAVEKLQRFFTNSLRLLCPQLCDCVWRVCKCMCVCVCLCVNLLKFKTVGGPKVEMSNWRLRQIKPFYESTLCFEYPA